MVGKFKGWRVVASSRSNFPPNTPERPPHQRASPPEQFARSSRASSLKRRECNACPRTAVGRGDRPYRDVPPRERGRSGPSAEQPAWRGPGTRRGGRLRRPRAGRADDGRIAGEHAGQCVSLDRWESGDRIQFERSQRRPRRGRDSELTRGSRGLGSDGSSAEGAVAGSVPIPTLAYVHAPRAARLRVCCNLNIYPSSFIVFLVHQVSLLIHRTSALLARLLRAQTITSHHPASNPKQRKSEPCGA